MKKKINLAHLEIESFVTSVPRTSIRGGYNNTRIGACQDSNMECQTQSDCGPITDDPEFCFPE